MGGVGARLLTEETADRYRAVRGMKKNAHIVPTKAMNSQKTPCDVRGAEGRVRETRNRETPAAKRTASGRRGAPARRHIQFATCAHAYPLTTFWTTNAVPTNWWNSVSVLSGSQRAATVRISRFARKRHIESGRISMPNKIINMTENSTCET